MWTDVPGLQPGPRKREAWEGLYYGFMTAATLLVTVGLWFKPNTKIKTWARDEAEVRNEMAENGEEVEYGANHAQLKYGDSWTREEFGVKPKRGEAEE